MSAWPARTPAQAVEYVRQDTAFWLPVIKQSGATAG